MNKFYLYILSYPVLWIRNDFFLIRIRILLFSWFWIPHNFFLIFLTKSLPMYSWLFKFVRLLIMTRYKLIREIFFWQKGIFIFYIEHLCWEIVKFYQFSRAVLLQIHFGAGAARYLGSGMISQDPDPAESFWSDRFRIQNTAHIICPQPRVDNVITTPHNYA